MLLTCQEIPRLASDYIGRELAMRTWLAVGLHLTVCRACRAYLRGLRRTQDLARASLRGNAPPEDLLRRLGLDGQDDARDLGERERFAVPPPEERDHDDPADQPRDLPPSEPSQGVRRDPSRPEEEPDAPARPVGSEPPG